MKLRLLLVSILLLVSVTVLKVCGGQKTTPQEDILVADSVAVKNDYLIDSVTARNLGESLWIDTSVCAVEIFITNEDIDDMKTRHPDDEAFYAVADDMNYYQAQARSFLEGKKIKLYYLHDSLQVINFNNRYWVDRKKAGYACFILYQAGKEPFVSLPINIEQDALNYFGADKIDMNINKPTDAK